MGFRYHHTGPVSGFFALRESLAILAERVKGHLTTFCSYLTKRHSQLPELSSLCCLYNYLHSQYICQNPLYAITFIGSDMSTITSQMRKKQCFLLWEKMGVAL